MPDLALGDYVRGTFRDAPIEGRVLRPLAPGVAIIQAAGGRTFMARSLAAVAGVWARVGQVMATRDSFFQCAPPAAVTVAVGTQTARLAVKAAAVGKRCGWKGSGTAYLEVAGSPHLCKITVTITAVDSENWSAEPTSFP